MKKTIITSFLFLSACTSGKPLKNKTQYLNGENYKGNVLGVPVLKNKTKESRVFGRVVSSGFLSGAPVFGAKITLTSLSKKILKKSTTNPKGEFVFLDQLPDGKYSLTITYKNQMTQSFLNLKGYELNVTDIYLE